MNETHKLQGSLPLGAGFSFQFGKGTFPATTTEKMPSRLGWEYQSGALVHESLVSLFPSSFVAFLPLPESSLQATWMLRELLSFPESTEPFGHLIADWPSELEHLISKIIKSYPSCVVAVEAMVAEKGFYESTREAESDHAHSAPVVYLESLNSIRYVLAKLDSTGLLPAQITCAGGQSAWLHQRQHAQLGIAPELLQAGAVIPYLQLVIRGGQLGESATSAEEQADTAFALSRSVLSALRSEHNARILMLVSEESLRSLGTALLEWRNKPAEPPPNLVHIQGKRPLEKLRRKYALCALTEGNNSEFAAVPGFVSRDFASQTDLPQVAWSAFLQRSFYDAFKRTSTRYTNWTNLSITAAQERDFFRFVHRLAAENALLFPSNFDLLLAARAVVDSNFAFEFLNEVRAFPDSSFASVLPTVKVPMQAVFRNVTQLSIRQFETLQKRKTMKPRLTKSVTSQKKVEPVSEEKYADNAWTKGDHPYACSFPDEDVFMEVFAFDCRRQVKDVQKSKDVVTHELGASLGDGLDIRETVRNWHMGKLMIKEERRTGKADIGSIVFDYSEAGDTKEYSWKSYWLAEQHDKSNLMFYATPYQDNIIGPGIAKSVFGGFAVIPIPSLEWGNPWFEPFVQNHSESPSDSLLLVAALSTEHRSLLYIAAHPPAKRVSDLLKRSGKTIIYLNIAELPQDKLRKVRTFHILAEAGVRNYAEKYIRKE